MERRKNGVRRRTLLEGWGIRSARSFSTNHKDDQDITGTQSAKIGKPKQNKGWGRKEKKNGAPVKGGRMKWCVTIVKPLMSKRQ